MLHNNFWSKKQITVPRLVMYKVVTDTNTTKTIVDRAMPTITPTVNDVCLLVIGEIGLLVATLKL